jgi:hypothetical protein
MEAPSRLVPRRSTTGRPAAPSSPVENTDRVAAVWFPSDPLTSAALAANLAGAPGAPGSLIDFDTDWADASSLLLDDLAPLCGPPDDVLGSASRGAEGVRVVAAPAVDPEVVGSLRIAGGGVVSLPATLAAARVAAEADVLVIGLFRSFPSLRHARLAFDALPAAHGEVIVTVGEGLPSDLTLSDVEAVLDHPVDVELPPGGREMAASLERGALPAARPDGPWSRAVVAIAARVWPGVETPVRRVRRFPRTVFGRHA